MGRHFHLVSQLKNKGITIEKIYYCPHQPDDDCQCRKPKAELGQKAIGEFNLETDKSYSVGDKDSDTLFGKNLGLTTVLIRNSQYQTKAKAEIEIDNIEELINHIVENEK